MTALTAQPARSQLADPAYQAFTLLRVGFTAAPILFGLDKFFEVMADWSTYLWPGVASAVPGGADTVMLAVGVIEILAGVLVAVRPSIGGSLLAPWAGRPILSPRLLPACLSSPRPALVGVRAGYGEPWREHRRRRDSGAGVDCDQRSGTVWGVCRCAGAQGEGARSRGRTGAGGEVWSGSEGLISAGTGEWS